MEYYENAVALFNETCEMIEHNDGDVASIENNLQLCHDLLHQLHLKFGDVTKRKKSKLQLVDPLAIKCLLSRCMVMQGQLCEWRCPGAAQVKYRDAIALDADNAEARTQLGRSLWQLATAQCPADLAETEQLFRIAISLGPASMHNDDAAHEAKMLLIRLLWQNSLCSDSSRLQEARALAASIGYTHILPHAIFDRSFAPASVSLTSSRLRMKKVCVYDDAMPTCMLRYLQTALGTKAAFWPCHGYNSPTTGFFSYQHFLKSYTSATYSSSMSRIVHHMWRVGSQRMPALARAKFGEWWAHCRYHSNGHKMHYDYVVDSENPDAPRHPIATCILYLTDDCGGSTFVTDQTIASGAAHSAFIVKPLVNRLVCFDGRLLHSVVPASGLAPGLESRRITLMVAFYERDPGAPDYDKLEESIVGNVVPLPDHHSESLEWVGSFSLPITCSCSEHREDNSPSENALVQLGSIADLVENDDKSRTESTLKRRRSSGLDFLASDKVFTYFEALNSGLVLAKKYL